MECRSEDADLLLVARVREGDVDASLILWRRHCETALTWAGKHVADRDDAALVVRRAFARVVSEIAADHDPVMPFLLYLCATVEDEAGAAPGEKTSDLSLVRAFRKLRGSYQTVLWYTVVEPLPGATVAVVLDREQTDLRVHARQAVSLLRAEWVAETVADRSVPDSCAWLVLRVDAYQAGMLGQLSEQRYERHLRGCGWCVTMVDALGNLLDVLQSVVLPPAADGSHALLDPEPAEEPTTTTC